MLILSTYLMISGMFEVNLEGLKLKLNWECYVINI